MKTELVIFIIRSSPLLVLHVVERVASPTSVIPSLFYSSQSLCLRTLRLLLLYYTHSDFSYSSLLPSPRGDSVEKRTGRIGKGISARALHRTVLETLTSHGSSNPLHTL
ncbi:MAG: hypothetical protein ORN54_01845, partial [Cyclobacteriaceae bacterium]|nr:hypothetical protein [Cyclobacteriaceae bacterium]